MVTRQCWEYLVEDGVSPERLNEAGAQGWELVNVARNRGHATLVFYFKRPAADLRERVTLDHRQRFVATAEQTQGSGE